MNAVNLDWDPEVDSPATVLVIGEDTVAIETALYARFLGYAVLLAVPKRILASELSFGSPTTWEQATSPLGLAALEAQELELPNSSGLSDSPTKETFTERYLIPLAKTDLLTDCVQINTAVRSLSRVGCLPYDQLTKEQLASQGFRVLLDSRKRGEYSQLVDIVLDCSGFQGLLGMASGGSLAVGESEFRPLQDSQELLATEQEPQHVVVYGRSAEALDRVASLSAQGQRVTWIIPRRYVTSRPSIPSSFEQELATYRAQHSAAETLAILDAWGVESILPGTKDGSWKIKVQIQEEETVDLECDVLLAEDAKQGDWSFANQLLYPREFLDVQSGLTQEPNYYVLGPKSGLKLGQESVEAPMQAYRSQIQKCFALIGGRAELNLYETVRPSG